MEKKQTSILNKLGTQVGDIGKKIGKLLPAIVATSFLSCLPANADYNKFSESNHFEDTSLAHVSDKTSSAKLAKIKANYNYVKHGKSSLEEIFSSNLNQINNKSDRSESDVRNEVMRLITEMNDSTLALANAYHALERETWESSGYTPEQVNQFAKEAFAQKGNREQQAPAIQILAHHYIHSFLNAETLVRLNESVDVAAFSDESHVTNSRNHMYIKKDTNTKLNEDINAHINYFFPRIVDFANWQFSTNKKTGKGQYVDTHIKNINNQVTSDIDNNLKDIKDLINKNNFSQRDKDSVYSKITYSPNIFPREIGGTSDMIKGLFAELAAGYKLNQLMEKLSGMGYDLTNLDLESYAKRSHLYMEVTGTPATGSLSTHSYKSSSISFGAGVYKPLGKTWDSSLGGEVGLRGDDQFGPTFQAFGKGEIGKTFAGTHRISLGAKGGFNVDKEGLSTPFGGSIGYEVNINKHFSLGIGVDTTINMQREYADLLGKVSASFRTKKGTIIKFSIGFGATKDWSDREQNNYVAPTNENTTENTTENTNDEITVPTDTTNEGYMNDNDHTKEIPTEHVTDDQLNEYSNY